MLKVIKDNYFFQGILTHRKIHYKQSLESSNPRTLGHFLSIRPPYRGIAEDGLIEQRIENNRLMVLTKIVAEYWPKFLS